MALIVVKMRQISVDGSASLFLYFYKFVKAGNVKRRIQAGRAWWRIDWREIWDYRDLLWLLVRRDFVAMYKQTVLGPLWFIIQPVAMTLVFTVVFGEIGGISTDGIPKIIFYMSGIMLWSYHQACLLSVSSSLVGNTQLLTKVYFPRLIMPLSTVIGNLIQLAISFIMFVCFWIYFKYGVKADLVISELIYLLPLLVIQAGLIGLGFGLWVAALTTKYRDLRFAIPFLTSLWMYATPIVWPASRLFGEWQKWSILFWINPLAPMAEICRYIFTSKGTVIMPAYGLSWIITVLVLATGLLAFNRTQRTFVDTI